MKCSGGAATFLIQVRNKDGADMDFSKSKIKNSIIDKLLHVSMQEPLFDDIAALHNSICVSFDTGVIAVASIDDDYLSTAFSKAYADQFGINNERALIIDANMYDPKLIGLLRVEPKESAELVELGRNVFAACLKKTMYPASVIKEGLVHNLLAKNKSNFDHTIIVVPSIKSHEDLILLARDVDCVVLVVQKNVTKKKDIFSALRFFEKERLPLARIVLIS